MTVLDNDRTRHALMGAAWITGAALFGIVCVILWWLLFPAQKITVDWSSPAVTPPVVTAGEIVTITTQEFCNEGVEVMVTRSLSNGTAQYQIDPVEYRAPEQGGCAENPHMQVAIPRDTPHGKWHLVIELTYRANPVRTVTVSLETPSFMVVDPERR